MEIPPCLVCGRTLADGEDPGPVFELAGVVVCPDCVVGGTEAITDEAIQPTSLSPCGDPGCPDCGPPPTDFAGVISRASYYAAEAARDEIEATVSDLLAQAGLLSGSEAVAEAESSAAYFAAAKIIAQETAARHLENPERVWGDLHAALGALSGLLSKTLGRRVAIQITERDPEPGA